MSPEFFERQECPECGETPAYLGRMHADDCSRAEGPLRAEYVTVRYVRERQPVPVTEEMVTCARLAGAAWFSEHDNGASSDDEWREHYRAVLEAALWGRA